MPIEPDAFRRALGKFATGVTVVTFRDAAARPGGLTVNAFTSVSLDPPLVLVCIDHHAESHPVMASADAYAVNVLAEDQTEVSRRFAARSIGVFERFDGLDWRPGPITGAPLIAGCLAHLECRVAGRFEAGDHTIFLGEVQDLAAGDGRPLLFFGGAYGHWTPRPAPAQSA